MQLSNPFKEHLKNKQIQYGLWMSSTSSYMAEISATSNYDWCLIDMEHAPNTLQTTLAQLQAVAPYPMHPVVRVAEGTKVNIKQALDIGAKSLLIPMVDTAEQAAKIVKAMEYPPEGVRGVGAFVARASRWGRVTDYMTNTNDHLCLLVQVETKLGIEQLDDILKVDGIDGVFIGAADLSASLGYPNNAAHPVVQDVMKTAIQKIVAAGKAAGFLAPNPDVAKRVIEWGVTFIAIGVDTMLYTQAIDQRLALFKTSEQSKPVLNSY